MLTIFAKRRRRWRCPRLKSRVDVADRQRRVPGFAQEVIRAARVLVVSAGGLGGEVTEGLVQKGYGQVEFCDMDCVATADLNRQKFQPRHIGRSKATSLCKTLSKRGFLGSELVAHPCPVQQLDLATLKPDVVFCGVDMQIPATRLRLCQTLRRLEIPGVFTAVSRDASWGYVFVQEKRAACWACALKPELEHPETSSDEDNSRCPGTPAVIDVLKTMAGLSLHAIDTLLMPGRVRDWNYRRTSLTHGGFDLSLHITPRVGCSVCKQQPLTEEEP